MWKRIIYADWAEAVPYVAFFLTFGVFLVLAIRALLMRKKKAEHMARLPLEGHTPPEESAEQDDDKTTSTDSPPKHDHE